MVRSPHGIHVDADGNVWVVDCACTGAGGGARGGGRGGRGGARGGGQPAPAPEALTTGHQIYKFSPDGTLLMTLGKAGGDSTQGGFFYQPNNMTTAPNGDIWVVEGHSSQAGVTPARVLRLDKAGKLLGVWGTVYDPAHESDPYAFNQPHAIAFDARGRLFVADRGNNRLKIFDPKDMKLLDTWYQFSRISGLTIVNDTIYAADSESGSVNPQHWAWTRGIRVGSARDGKVVAFIPDPTPTCYSRIQSAGAPASAGSNEQPCANNTWAAEGIAVDPHGVIYGAEVGPKALKRYVRK
jgi:hypothetical protein